MMVNLLYLFVVAVQSLSCVQLFVTPRTAAHQAPLSFTISWSLLKFMSIELVMPSNHLILCRPFLLLPSIVPASGGQSIGASASASVLPMNIQDWFPIRLTDLTAAFLSWNDWRMLKSPVVGTWNVVNPNRGVLLSHRREWSPCTLYSTEGPWKHGAQWEKPVTKGHML